jgi:8-oxo-dGTP pyrophosphatase MutT (NUDIX family)
MGRFLSLKNVLKQNVEEISGVHLPPAGIQSSVLVLIGTPANDPSGALAQFILTKRTHTVLTHKGQVSFPGGYREPEDNTLQDTALRESQEEIGLAPARVEVLGFLDPVRTIRDVFILPWVGLTELPYDFKLNPNEVERLIHLPVNRLITEGLAAVDIREGAVQIHSTGIYVEEELIWGATAKMLDMMRTAFAKAGVTSLT